MWIPGAALVAAGLVRSDQLTDGQPEAVVAGRRAERERAAEHDELVTLRARNAGLAAQNDILTAQLKQVNLIGAEARVLLGHGAGRLMARPRKASRNPAARSPRPFRSRSDPGGGASSAHRTALRSVPGTRRGELALARGLALPDPAEFQVPGAAAPDVPAGKEVPILAEWWFGPTAAGGHDLEKVAHSWAAQRYDTLRRAQLERRDAVLAIIDHDLQPWLEKGGDDASCSSSASSGCVSARGFGPTVGHVIGFGEDGGCLRSLLAEGSRACYGACSSTKTVWV